MLLVTKDAYGKLRPWDVLKLLAYLNILSTSSRLSKVFPIFKTLGEGPSRKNSPTTSHKEVNVLDGSRETLVLLRVVVLETNLEIDGLSKFPLFRLSGVLNYFTYAFEKGVFRNFRRHIALGRGDIELLEL